MLSGRVRGGVRAVTGDVAEPVPVAEGVGAVPGAAAVARGHRPERRYAPASELTVLHLSDPQFGREHLFGGNGLTAADRDRDSLFARLHEDLGRLADRDGLWPDLVVVTGDLAEWGLPSEFREVVEFLERLVEAVGLPRHRVAIVPGNHDVNRKACEQYFNGEEAEEREPVPPYWPKWRHYAAAFDRFYAEGAWSGQGVRPEFTPERPWTLFEMSDLKVVVAGVNSTMKESHRDGDHHGWVGEGQLAWFADQVRPYRGAGWLVLAAVHHNAVRGAVNDDENLKDADDLDRILGHDAPGYPRGGPGAVHLLLHGHTHDGRVHRLNSGLLALSTGSAAVRAEARPAEVPNQYQLLTLRPDGVTRHARAYFTDLKVWTGDNRADVVADTWRHTLEVALTAPAALAAPAGDERDVPGDPGGFGDPWGDHPVGERRGKDRGGPRAGTGFADPFLDEVAEVTRLRLDGAEVRAYPSVVMGRSYLRVVRRDEFGPVDRWPVGAVAGQVTQEVLDTFVAAVHAPFQSADANLRSHLVYGGPAPEQRVRAAAVAAGVGLHSLVEYRGVIDLGRVRERQREQVERDTRYPAGLYVGQRFRCEHPARRWDADRRPVVEDGLLEQVAGWLGEGGARFVTVLGDFGRGKTFLMRQLVRALPGLVGGLEPLLLELHSVDKGPDLYDLVGQYLRRLDVADVTDAKVRHLISRGRVALLLDGFDELVQRVTYPTAAAYLGTLLAAATGEAKIVLTSRGQHFSDDSQVRDALLATPAGRDASRIVALEDFTDTQIREFLRRLYFGDDARASYRLTRLGEVKDLLGLSRNPRMLAFIAALPKGRLEEAQHSGDRVGAAELYREILDHWLQGEVKRQSYAYGRTVLPEGQRLAACRALALRLWTAPDADGDAVGVEELTRTTAATLTELETLGFSGEEATYTVGSGSLLTRTSRGFGFVHRSVLEWLVADTAAAELKAGTEPTALAAREMSDLMTDFFCDLAGHDTALQWANTNHGQAGPDTVVSAALRANATRVQARLRRRASDEQPADGAPARLRGGAVDEPPAPGWPGGSLVGAGRVEPLDLTGQDLRDQDVAALALTGEGGRGLRGVVLRDTVWAGKRLVGLDLTGADLTGADLRRTRLDRVELAGARLAGAQLAEARLTEVSLAGADLTSADLTRARLADVDLADAAVAGSTWTRAVVLGGAAVGQAAGLAELGPAAVVGRDRAEPQLAATGAVQAVATVADLGMIAVARGRSVELVDLASRQPIRVLAGHTDWVLSVAAVGLADGRTLLASGGGDGTVRLWDPVTGAAVGEPLAGHTGPVWSVAAVGLADGRTLLASGGGDRTVRLWDPVTGAAVGEPLAGHTGWVWSVAAVGLADGRTLLASGGGDRTVRLWDPVTGAAVGEPLAGHTGWVRSVAAVGLADGQTLLASGGGDGTVRLWTLTTHESRRTAPALRPAEAARAGQRTKRRAVVDAARAAFGLREAPPAAQTAAEPTAEPVEHPVPEIEAEHVATIAPSRNGGWATLLPDGRSYKSAGDVSDVLWWAVKLCRFEAGELDPYDPTIHSLPHPQPIL